jgi:hypothetical protein
MFRKRTITFSLIGCFALFLGLAAAKRVFILGTAPVAFLTIDPLLNLQLLALR